MRFGSYELVSEWKNSQCGQTAIATRGGRKYFLKKYQTPVMPIENKTLDAKTFAHNKELFNHFLKTRKTVNSRIRPLTGEGGNIVIPADEFVEGNQYVEAAELVEGVVPEEELEGVLASLSPDVKKLLMQTAAGALSSIHKLGIVHSDLKLKNVLLARNAAGNYVAKLIDFDSSYPLDDKPDEIVGDINYYSPELGVYADVEDEDERRELAAKLTEKSDIFSLGLIFHQYLAGTMPVIENLTDKLKKRRDKGKIIYCWAALVNGATLAVSPVIESPKYRLLIEDMLKLDPAERPSALDVLKRLKAEDVVIEEPWPEHGIVLDTEAMKKAGIVGLKKVDDGTKEYELIKTDGSKRLVDADTLGLEGLLKRSMGFCEPWEDHAFVFDTERIKSRGFVGVTRATLSGIRGYTFYRADSSSTFFKKEMLIGMKYATPAKTTGDVTPAAGGEKAVSDVTKGPDTSAKEEVKPVPAVAGSICEPWPMHRIVFDADKMEEKGFVGVEQATLGGVNGYQFTKADGSTQFLRVEMACIQKLANKV